MTRLAGRAALTAVIAVLALSACGSDPETSVGDDGGTQQPTITVPGQPADLVTDVVAGELTEEQAQAILEACLHGVGVPGTSNECREYMEHLPPLPPCGTRICFYSGRLVDDENAGFIQVDQQDSESSVCAGESVALCEGLTVPVAVVEPLLEDSASAPASTGAGTSSAPTSTEPTSTEPTSSEPTSSEPTPSEPTPSESVEPTATSPMTAAPPPP